VTSALDERLRVYLQLMVGLKWVALINWTVKWVQFAMSIMGKLKDIVECDLMSVMYRANAPGV